MGVSPLAMMGMHEQYPWMKEKKSSRKNQMAGRETEGFVTFSAAMAALYLRVVGGGTLEIDTKS